MGNGLEKKIFKEPAAASLFLVLHKLFPDAEFSKDVPDLGAANLAGWWRERFTGISQFLSEVARMKSIGDRNSIVSSLEKISLRVTGKAPANTPTVKELGEHLVNAFNRLVSEIKRDLPTNDPKTKTFEDGSISLLIGLSGYLEADKRGQPADLVTAGLKLGEETRRLRELVSDPPKDLKIMEGEAAEAYLEAVNKGFGPNPKDSAGAEITKEVLKILEESRGGRKPQYLEALARKVKELRGVLMLATTKGLVDADTARRSILIAEAMTPEYSTRPGGDKGRKPPTQSQFKELEKSGESVKTRIMDEWREDPKRFNERLERFK